MINSTSSAAATFGSVVNLLRKVFMTYGLTGGTHPPLEMRGRIKKAKLPGVETREMTVL